MKQLYTSKTVTQLTVKAFAAFLLLIFWTTNAFAQLSGPQTVCPGETTTYTYSGTAGTYQWSLTSGTGSIIVADDGKSADVTWSNTTTAATVNIKVSTTSSIKDYPVKVGIKSVNGYTPKLSRFLQEARGSLLQM